MDFDEVQLGINNTPDNIRGNYSDGYHSFNELYDHRCILFILAAKRETRLQVWRSKTHSDGSVWDGWFLLGIGKDKGYQITYHLPVSLWDKCGFAETLMAAPEFDGHTPADVLQRLKDMI